MSETTDEFITAAWIVGAPVAAAGKWAGRKAYHGAQRAGMAYQNWRYGGAGDNPRGSDPYAQVSSFAPSAQGNRWTSVETSETTSYYHHSSTKWSREGSGKE